MQKRRSLILSVLLLVVAGLTGCGHKTALQVNSITVTCNTCIFPNGATGVEFAPSNQLVMDLTEGQVESLSVTLLGRHGESLSGPDFPINYTTDDPSAISISPSGEVCGGVWDAQYVVCRPGTIPRLCQSPVDPLFPPLSSCALPTPTPGASPTPTPGPSPT